VFFFEHRGHQITYISLLFLRTLNMLYHRIDHTRKRNCLKRLLIHILRQRLHCLTQISGCSFSHTLDITTALFNDGNTLFGAQQCKKHMFDCQIFMALVFCINKRFLENTV
jgi:hypothetical protein